MKHSAAYDRRIETYVCAFQIFYQLRRRTLCAL